jgi:hypothetical protein
MLKMTGSLTKPKMKMKPKMKLKQKLMKRKQKPLILRRSKTQK